jgi:hypothetical protein
LRIEAETFPGARIVAHGFCAQLDTMGVVNQTVRDALADGRIAGLRVQRETGSWEVRIA